MTGYVLDASWARHGWAAVKAAGFTGVSLYLSNDPSKNCKPVDVAEVQAAGLHLMLNWESQAGRPKDGRAAGTSDAQKANQLADALGYPRDTAIYYSCDTDAQPGDVRAYYQGAAAVGLRPVGAYGGAVVVVALLNEGTTRFAWVANAGSWDHGVSDTGAHLHQHYHTHNVLPVPAGWGLNDYDESVVLQNNYGQWGATVPQVVLPKESDMLVIQVDNNGTPGPTALVTDGKKEHLTDADLIAVYNGLLRDHAHIDSPIKVSQAQYDKIPDRPAVTAAGAPAPVPPVDLDALAAKVADVLAKRLAA